MTKFSIFNATPDDILIAINGTKQIFIPRTGDTSNWTPQQPAETVLWSGHDVVADQLGYAGCIVGFRRALPEPSGGQLWAWKIPSLENEVNINSLQLYIFSGKEGRPQALLLRDGFPLALTGSLSTINSGMFQMA